MDVVRRCFGATDTASRRRFIYLHDKSVIAAITDLSCSCVVHRYVYTCNPAPRFYLAAVEKTKIWEVTPLDDCEIKSGLERPGYEVIHMQEDRYFELCLGDLSK